MHKLNKIIFVNSLGGGTPACVNRRTGAMYIDRVWWNSLTLEHRFFILLHEYAHAQLNTRNEFLADDLAFKIYVSFGYSITECVHALTRVLNYTRNRRGDLTRQGREQVVRTLKLIDTAKKYDKGQLNAWHRTFYNY